MMMKRSCPNCKGNWVLVTLNVGRDTASKSSVTVSGKPLIWEKLDDNGLGFYRTDAKKSNVWWEMTDVSDWDEAESLARFLGEDLAPGDKGVVRLWRRVS